jgi:hypothetical protein
MGAAVIPHAKLAHIVMLLTPAHTDTCDVTHSWESQIVMRVPYSAGDDKTWRVNKGELLSFTAVTENNADLRVTVTCSSEIEGALN